MNRVLSIVATTFCWVSFIFAPTQVLAQLADIRIIIDQRTNDGVNVNYGFRVDAPRLFFTGLPGQVTAPDGTVFATNNSSSSNLTFPELSNRIFGNWSIAERTGTGNANHTFAFNTFTLSNVFSEIPRIVAPVPSGQSAVVNSTFNISWDYASGATPTGRVATANQIVGGRIAFSNFTTNAVQATATLNQGADQANFNVSAGSFTSLNSFLGSVVRDANGLGSNWTTQASFNTLSQPIQLTVVPEPSSVLLCLVFTGFIVLRALHKASGKSHLLTDLFNYR